MLELTLVRHAKSDWGDPSLPDHDRPLNARGARNAPMMAERLASTGIRINRIISSTALRARATAVAFGAVLDVDVALDPELYLSSADEIIAAAVASGGSRTMLVAHDPGISELAHRLSNGVIEHMPTCAVARFSWRAESWSFAATRPADAWSLDTPRGGSAHSGASLSS